MGPRKADTEVLSGHNTGYKNYDPSHPCTRCWDKYARPYTSIMAHAPWSSDAQSGSGSSRTTYQRPLPRFRAPHSSLHQSNASNSGSPTSPSGYNHSRSASTSRVSSGYPGSAARVIPIPGGGVPVPVASLVGPEKFPYTLATSAVAVPLDRRGSTRPLKTREACSQLTRMSSSRIGSLSVIRLTRKHDVV